MIWFVWESAWAFFLAWGAGVTAADADWRGALWLLLLSVALGLFAARNFEEYRQERRKRDR